jgi:hypothetical protein
LSNTMTGTEHQ